MPMNVAPRGLPMFRYWPRVPVIATMPVVSNDCDGVGGARRTSRREGDDRNCNWSLNKLSVSSIFEPVACDGPQDTELLRRNSCVIAMPMEANASDVRSQARNVRSVSVSQIFHAEGLLCVHIPNAR